MGEVAGAYGNGRRIVQTLCASVLHVPISLGAIQKVLDRVSQAIEPHYLAIATQTRHAPVNYIDETPWFLTHTLQWLWAMVSDTAALYMIHPHRSKEAFTALIDDWAGILVSDGYGVYQNWVQARQTCLAHLIRSAQGGSRAHPDLAACGTWALARVAAAVSYGHGPTDRGEWRAWYARLCKLIDQYHARSDEAGRFARRLLREMDSLWVFLAQQAWSRPIIELNGPYGLVSSGVNGPSGRRAPRAITGWSDPVPPRNLSSPGTIDVHGVSGCCRPACSRASSLMSPGLVSVQPSQNPCDRLRRVDSPR